MIYPKWLKTGDLIGIPAPSAGIPEEKIPKFDLSIEQIKKAGYRVRETDSVRSGLIASASGKVRGQEFMELVEDKDVDMILCASGGDFLIDMLPFLDEEKIKANPKWIQGYSDPTSILFSVTTGLDIATIYGCNGGGFGMTKLHPSLEENLKLWKGELAEQSSYDLFEGKKPKTENAESERSKSENPESENQKPEFDGYRLTDPVEWTTPNGPVKASGRLIGGCIDVIDWMIGTPYEDLEGFCSRYAEDGFIWFFDNFELNPMNLMYSMIKMKMKGLFDNAKAIVFGRVCFPGDASDIDYLEQLERVFADMDLPVIWGADIGHTKPSMTIINGSIGHLTFSEGKASLSMELI
jgi:muramoyltetrapeptide carboxypeptidase LdcA involved in peptidoglycan recycling